MGNSLQEVLNRAKSDKTDDKQPDMSRDNVLENRVNKRNRGNTVLIGGHFSPEVAKQLRIIAAEEGTTNQALLKQALDLLFTKKGKKLIVDS